MCLKEFEIPFKCVCNSHLAKKMVNTPLFFTLDLCHVILQLYTLHEVGKIEIVNGDLIPKLHHRYFTELCDLK